MPGEPRGVSRYVFVAAFCVWLPGCGGKSETIEPPAAVHADTSQLFASGTRLKAHYLDGGGGARKLLAFRDSLLDVECQFVETAARQYACLPTASTRTFSDSACSAPSIPVASDCPGAPVPIAGQLISAPSLDCTTQVAAYSLDALQDRATEDPSYSLTIHGTCFSPMPQPAPSAQWTTKPEPLARFVQGTPSTVGAAGGLQATRITGDDGAFTTLELVTAGAVCTAITFGEVQRCVPQPLVQTFFYSYTDASCTDASVAYVDPTIAERCAGVKPQYLVASTAADCHVLSAIYALGDPLSRVFANAGPCAAIDLEGPAYSGDSFYRKGPLVPADVLPLVHSAQIGTGAVTALYYADSTSTPILARGALARSGEWELSDGTQCTPLEDPSGQLRCVHHAWLVGSVDEYADASCTVPVYTDSLGCASSAIRYIVDTVFDSCSSRLTQTHVAKVYSGPRYSLQSGSCQLDQYSGPSPFFSLGDPVDASIFPLISDVVDP